MSAETSPKTPWDDLLSEIRQLRSERERADSEIWDAIEDLRRLLVEARPESVNEPVDPSRMAEAEYRRVRYLFRRMVEREVPAGSKVAIVSRGDHRLIEFLGREGEHFPQDPSGDYAGFHPVDGTGVIAHLEWLRARQIEWLAFPASSVWWLESYPKLARHLERTAAPAVIDESAGALFDLRCSGTGVGADTTRIAGLLDAWEASHGSPSLLDWESGLELEDHLSDQVVFSPPDPTAETLPYLERSVDVVAVGSPERMEEARRVARLSVVLVGMSGRDDSIEIEHLDTAPEALPSASIVIPTYDGVRHLLPCLRGLRSTLPEPFRGEVIVVDDGSGSETRRALEEKTAELPWLTVVRNEQNLGFIGSCNRGAEVATGELLVFLNDDTVPLPGWIESLVGTFRLFPDAGAVGGRLLYPDGRLQEAGGLIYRDGTGANVGKGDWDVDAPRYNWVRNVDYCSGALLATPRELFADLGGFDRTFLPAYYEDADYCFRVRELGRPVYYQPRAAIIHAEGATSGVDPTAGAKRHQTKNRYAFRRRWSHELSSRVAAPGAYSDLVWQGLTLHGSQSGSAT